MAVVANRGAAEHAEAGRATVAVACADGTVRAEVADDGVGGATPGGGTRVRAEIPL